MRAIPGRTMRLYDYLSSGNGYKCRLVLARLGIACTRIELDIMAGATRTPAFLAKNPNGRVPALELDDGTVLAESNAIMAYLARGSDLLPEERLPQAQVLQWLFFEQYSHEPYIAVARYIRHLLPAGNARETEMPRLLERGHAALAVMEAHLENRRFFVGDRCTIADYALYAYTHVAHEGDFDLRPYAHLRATLDRISSQPHHIPITQG
jgi:glutathione S-transferase